MNEKIHICFPAHSTEKAPDIFTLAKILYNIHDVLLKLSIERVPSSHSSHFVGMWVSGTRTWTHIFFLSSPFTLFLSSPSILFPLIPSIPTTEQAENNFQNLCSIPRLVFLYLWLVLKAIILSCIIMICFLYYKQ